MQQLTMQKLLGTGTPVLDVESVKQPGLVARIAKAMRQQQPSTAVDTITRKVILIFIPAHNEERGIEDCLEGVADQMVDFDPAFFDVQTVVISDNSTDATVRVAQAAIERLGLHGIVIETKGNKQKKVGALNYAWAVVYGDPIDAELNDIEPTAEQEAYRASIKGFLGMDADSRMAPGALKSLWDHLMSRRDIGGVMTRYTMRMPEPMKHLSKSDPHYEIKAASGKYGGAMARWWTAMQKQDMASWLLNLFARGGSTYVLGGQATLFRPEALADVVNHWKALGPWSPDTMVEDMDLTWRLQELNWKTVISPEARTYVDAMTNTETFVNQRMKWDGGLVGLLTSRNGVKSSHTWFLWSQQAKMLLDMVTRVLFFTFTFTALATGEYQWRWLWLVPPVVASILNIRIAMRVPQHRPIDVFLAATLVSPEIYLIVRLYIWTRVWTGRLSSNENDGWAKQYAAEKRQRAGRSKAPKAPFIGAAVVAGAGFACYHYHYWLSSHAVQFEMKPILSAGFIVLTILAIFQVLAMLRQHWALSRATPAV